MNGRRARRDREECRRILRPENALDVEPLRVWTWERILATVGMVLLYTACIAGAICVVTPPEGAL